MPLFSSLELLPEDPILSITSHFKSDPRPHKVNLGVGTYKDGEGKPYVFSSVRQAETLILNKKLDKEYFPIDGSTDYSLESLKLLFGDDAKALHGHTLYGMQGVGGAGALRIGADLLLQTGKKTAWLSDPTWPNHKGIFEHAGLKIGYYPYYDFDNHCLNFSAFLDKVEQLPEGDVLVLHGCCHNPTGVDFSRDQWKTLSDLMKKRGLIPFFDMAYQGFKEGLEEDAFPVRHFLKEGHEMLVASSYSKNFGLYGERAGFLGIVAHEKESIEKIASQVKILARTAYSNPPIHPARIVTTILTDPLLKEEWKKELDNIRLRIQHMREALYEGLAAKGEGERFHFLKNQCGMFSFMGITKEQADLLKKEEAIYMAGTRINVAGLNEHNLEKVVNALLSLFHRHYH